MKIQNLGCSALLVVIAASAVQAQGMGPSHGMLAPAGWVQVPPGPTPAPGYDPAVLPAGAMMAANCDDAGAGPLMPGGTPACGCSNGGLLGLFGGGGCDGSCGGSCGGLGAGSCGSGGCGVLGGGFGSCLSGLMGPFGPDGGRLGPNGTGTCCLPRWFDVHTEWMFLKREDSGRTVNLASDQVLGPIVLSTDDLSLDEVSGFRVTGALIVGPSTNVEVTYFGTFNWADSAQVLSSTNELFSVYSDFGINPIQGFPETDEASLARIAYSSALDNGELNLRRRWVSANCLLHGSWLAGVRYISLIEDFEYFTQTATANTTSLVNTENDLIGFQLGSELFVCLTSRLKVGAEVEAGLYGVRAKQHTTVSATSGASLDERERDDDVAFVSEAGAMGVYRLTPRATLRAGYQVLYLDGVALATENFNTDSPFSIRSPILNHNGNAFYHGAAAGIEWTW